MVDRLVDDSEDVKYYLGKCGCAGASREFEQGKIIYGKFFWLKSPIFLAVTPKTYHNMRRYKYRTDATRYLG